jgi:hypothetical protein
VETIRTDKFEDALGINDWEDLELAECTSGLIVGDRNYHSPKTK